MLRVYMAWCKRERFQLFDVAGSPRRWQVPQVGSCVLEIVAHCDLGQITYMVFVFVSNGITFKNEKRTYTMPDIPPLYRACRFSEGI